MRFLACPRSPRARSRSCSAEHRPCAHFAPPKGTCTFWCRPATASRSMLSGRRNSDIGCWTAAVLGLTTCPKTEPYAACSLTSRTGRAILLAAGGAQERARPGGHRLRRLAALVRQYQRDTRLAVRLPLPAVDRRRVRDPWAVHGPRTAGARCPASGHRQWDRGIRAPG
jgi:hypothetical protein